MAAVTGGTAVELHQLTLKVADRVLLENVTARFEPGEVTLIIGASGAGKSLLLQILAGTIGPGNGQVQFSGEIHFGATSATMSKRRPPVGVVFQYFALFDELTPTENVRFARDHRPRSGRPSTSARPAALLDELHVPTRIATSALSGGQQQRLAIARTLAYDPDVILYDEPTSGLDGATATRVAGLIENTHAIHPKTSIIVTHDYESLPPIADRIYLLDPATRSLREIPRDAWPTLRSELLTPANSDASIHDFAAPATRPGLLRRAAAGVGRFFASTSITFEKALQLPFRLLPIWRSPYWGVRYLLHYLRLVAGPSACAYISIAGLIIGFVATHFTFKFLPYGNYTEPLLIENLLNSMGFALYRILVPVLVTILVAARCGAAVASDVGGKKYGRQIDALRTFGASPERYLLTNIVYAFLLGTPALVGLGYLVAKTTSLLVFAVTHPERGPEFWHTHFHRQLEAPGEWWYIGTGWLVAKTLVCAAGIAMIAYYSGVRPKSSSRDVSSGITTAILWSTVYVLVVQFLFTFFEFD